MGRCQGGFCTSRIVQILSQRLGVPLANITKRGANTQIVYQEISELAAIAQGHTKTYDIAVLKYFTITDWRSHQLFA